MSVTVWLVCGYIHTGQQEMSQNSTSVVPSKPPLTSPPLTSPPLSPHATLLAPTFRILKERATLGK